MKTLSYNPSPLEVDFTKAIVGLEKEIEQKIGMKIHKVDADIHADNPSLRFYLEDADGDKHQVVIRVIQKPDDYV
ncbi:MAG: hypothetical protein JJU28_18250 [Cyclobacteriaceae bacterium]|nr:hypothetical protein [Cyclobacteriaceae bacterium]